MLAELARRKGASLPNASAENDMDREYDKLADWVRSSMDMDLIYHITGLSRDYDATRT